jgi:biopolymer transport protein ExbD
MKIQVRKSRVSADPDMTPMIDMTFQLVAFFMIVINFTAADQDQRIQLPSSQLAKPPEVPFDQPLTLQLTDDGNVLFQGDVVPVSGLRPYLTREVQVMERLRRNKSNTTVIIRADRNARAGKVQELIRICQDVGFERFALRARHEQAPT